MGKGFCKRSEQAKEEAVRKRTERILVEQLNCPKEIAKALSEERTIIRSRSSLLNGRKRITKLLPNSSTEQTEDTENTENGHENPQLPPITP